MPGEAGVRDTPPTDVAVEAHYYDSGLKVERLAGGTVQPPWIPADPGDAVGLHEAFKPEAGDRIVEISRLRVAGQHLSWIAIYRYASDASYGNRSNYAGIGVWLLNQTVTAPNFLLDALETLSGWMLEKGIADASRIAGQFLAPEQLPKHLAAMQSMPAGLSGWAFSEGLLPPKALYQLGVDRPETPDWRPIADQLTRMTLLPGPTPAHARALILMRSANAASFPVDGVPLLKDGLATDLLKALPAALTGLATDTAALRRQHETTVQHVQRIEAELAATRAAEADARQKIVEFEQQAAANDPDARLRKIVEKLDSIHVETRGISTVLAQHGTKVATILTDVRAGFDRARAQERPLQPSRPYPTEATVDTRDAFADGDKRQPAATAVSMPFAASQPGPFRSLLGHLGRGSPGSRLSPPGRWTAISPGQLAMLAILVILLIAVVVLATRKSEPNPSPVESPSRTPDVDVRPVEGDTRDIGSRDAEQGSRSANPDRSRSGDRTDDVDTTGDTVGLPGRQ